jgi:hypothetical protein
VTAEFRASVTTHLDGQSIPPPETCPPPVIPTVRVVVLVEVPQTAFTVLSPLSSTVHDVPVPEQAPPQPVKMSLVESGVSITVNVDPVGTGPQLQSPLAPVPQSISPGAVTCP